MNINKKKGKRKVKKYLPFFSAYFGEEEVRFDPRQADSIIEIGIGGNTMKDIRIKDIRIGVRLDTETHRIAKELSPEGNISMWIRSLIRKQIEQQKEKATP